VGCDVYTSVEREKEAQLLHGHLIWAPSLATHSVTPIPESAGSTNLGEPNSSQCWLTPLFVTVIAHGINALMVFGLTGILTGQAWRAARAPATGAGAVAPS
jgi:hypothetical protein